MKGRKVSEITIRRLSHYARCLRDAKSKGEITVTSGYFSRRCGISSAAVRKDLTMFGEFGKQGSGYNVIELLEQIENILGTCDPPFVIIVGAGNIGRALLESGLEGTGGHSYAAIFDIDPRLVGMECAGLTVKSMDEIQNTVSGHENFIAIVAVSEGEGQKVVDRLIDSGFRAILSFNLEPLNVPDGVELRYIEVSTELDLLTYFMKT